MFFKRLATNKNSLSINTLSDRSELVHPFGLEQGALSWAPNLIGASFQKQENRIPLLTVAGTIAYKLNCSLIG